MPKQLPDWAPDTVDMDRPSSARVYDYLLGGACNFEHDREFADKLLETLPEAARAARNNRAFLRRAVRFCVAQGVRQFLDLGSGIPTVGNVHEIAQQADPECRVVYVDNEPIAVAHSELMLEHNDRAGAVLADLSDPDAVLGAEPVRRLIDFDRPVAVLMVSVLHFVPDSADPAGKVARYVDAMAPGSYLVLSHAAMFEQSQIDEMWRLINERSTPGSRRTREEIMAFMAGTEVVDPGLVWTSQWQPDPRLDAVDRPEMSLALCAVGRKP